MKVYLISPPAPGGIKMIREGRCMQKEGVWTTIWPPISLALSASVLVQEGFEVFANDCNTEEMLVEDFRNKLKEIQPDLLVINSTTPSIEFDLSMSKEAKSVLPQIKTAVFGIHVTTLPEDSFKMEPDLDYIIRGEPEMGLLELAQALRDNKSFENILGIAYRAGDKIQITPDRPYLDPNDLPFPAWNLINHNLYQLPFSGKPFLLVSSGRGCPYDCTFCVSKAYYGKKVRMRDPLKVVDEIAWAQKEFKVNDFFFWSESFTLMKKQVMAICDEILKRNLRIRWVCNSRVDNVSEELLRKMRESGCWLISYGIESGNQEILDRSKKGTTLDQARDAVAISRKFGFQLSGHFLFGLPGETVETMKKSIEFARELDLDFAQFYCATPWPGTGLYEKALKNGWLTTTEWSKFEQSIAIMDLDTVTAEEVMEWRRKANKAFYLRPGKMVRTGINVLGDADLGYLFSTAKKYFGWTTARDKDKQDS